MNKLGHFDGKYYWLVQEDGGEQVVSKEEYELKTSNDPLAKYIWEILQKLNFFAGKTQNL